jgi:FkbM family methyltransferase
MRPGQPGYSKLTAPPPDYSIPADGGYFKVLRQGKKDGLCWKLFERQIDGATTKFWYRPGTSDEGVMKENLVTRIYRNSQKKIDVLPDQMWLDLGANIGAFALYCWLHRCYVCCYEPVNSCYAILERNIEGMIGSKCYHTAVTVSTDPMLTFYGAKSGSDYQRGTIHPTRQVIGELRNRHISSISPKKYDGVKMDIEGSEFGILDAKLLPPCDTLLMEYHITKDKSMVNFRKRMKYLRTLFSLVTYPGRLDKPYPDDTYPGWFDRMVRCRN